MVPTPLKMGVVQENDECGICMFEYLLILPILFYILNAFVKKKEFHLLGFLYKCYHCTALLYTMFI